MRRHKQAPLRFAIKQKQEANGKYHPPWEEPPAKIVIGMDHSFPEILRVGDETHESTALGLGTYPPFQPKVQCYLWVSSHPKDRVERIYLSSSFKRKSLRTLKRLAFSKRLSVRHAAELEIIKREMIDHYFPCKELTQ